MAVNAAQIYNSAGLSLPEDENSKPLLSTEPGHEETSSMPIVFELFWGFLGGLIGFLVRIISLRANILVSSSSQDSTSYFILSQADLAVHAMIWIFFFILILACKSVHRRRVLTSSVVSLMIGVLVGSFLAWNLIDMTLGFPLAWTSRLLSFNLMLVQCWLLYRCHQVVVDEQAAAELDDKENEDGPSIAAFV